MHFLDKEYGIIAAGPIFPIVWARIANGQSETLRGFMRAVLIFKDREYQVARQILDDKGQHRDYHYHYHHYDCDIVKAHKDFLVALEEAMHLHRVANLPPNPPQYNFMFTDKGVIMMGEKENVILDLEKP